MQVKNVRIIVTVFAILLLVMSAFLIHRNPGLTIESATHNIKNSACFNADMEGVYYKAPVSDEFFNLLQEDSWEKISDFSSDDPLITINYAERHNVYFYSDGRAVIYDGYEGLFQKGKEYYAVPVDTADKLAKYIIENGVMNPQGVKDTTFL